MSNAVYARQPHEADQAMLSDSLTHSNAALPFDNQDPCFSPRMRNMLTSNPCVKHVARLQCHDALNA